MYDIGGFSCAVDGEAATIKQKGGGARKRKKGVSAGLLLNRNISISSLMFELSANC